MNTRNALTVIAALVIGFGSGYLLNGRPAEPETPDHSLHQQMDSMTAGLEGKSGDEFDKAFLLEMIVHHEGAVEMAEAALASAKHEEIKDMAHAIISAQTSEISQMRSWLAAWYAE